MDEATGAWFDREVAGCRLADRRLDKRLRGLLERMGDAMGASIPLACQDWASTKAAYRFFSNVSNSTQSGPRIGMQKGPLTGVGRGLSR